MRSNSRWVLMLAASVATALTWRPLNASWGSVTFSAYGSELESESLWHATAQWIWLADAVLLGGQALLTLVGMRRNYVPTIGMLALIGLASIGVVSCLLGHVRGNAPYLVSCGFVVVAICALGMWRIAKSYAREVETELRKVEQELHVAAGDVIAESEPRNDDTTARR